MEDKRYTWHVEGSIPPDNQPHAYRKNINLQVIAVTLEQVVEAVTNAYPGINFTKIFKERWVNDVIVVVDDA